MKKIHRIIWKLHKYTMDIEYVLVPNSTANAKENNEKKRKKTWLLDTIYVSSIYLLSSYKKRHCSIFFQEFICNVLLTTNVGLADLTLQYCWCVSLGNEAKKVEGFLSLTEGATAATSTLILYSFPKRTF